MKKKLIAVLLTASMFAGILAGCGSSTADGGAASTEEGKVINIYSWNNEFQQRVEAVYSEVAETSSDGTVTKLKDGTEIHWIINPNQDGVYQQKLDEALMNQGSAAADDKVDIFLSETDYVYKYTDERRMLRCPSPILVLIRRQIWRINMILQRRRLLMQKGYREVPHGNAVRDFWYTVETLPWMYLVRMIRQPWEKR